MRCRLRRLEGRRFRQKSNIDFGSCRHRLQIGKDQSADRALSLWRSSSTCSPVVLARERLRAFQGGGPVCRTPHRGLRGRKRTRCGSPYLRPRTDRRRGHRSPAARNAHGPGSFPARAISLRDVLEEAHDPEGRMPIVSYRTDFGIRRRGNHSAISGNRMISSRIASIGTRMIATSRKTCTTFSPPMAAEINRHRP